MDSCYALPHHVIGTAALLYLAMLTPQLHKLNRMAPRRLLLDDENHRMSNEQQAYIERLRRSEEEYRLLATNLPVAVIRYDAQQRLCYINPAAERMLHGNATQMLGQVPGEGVPATPAMIALYLSQMAEVLAMGEIREFEFVLDALPEGRHEHYQVRMAPECGNDGQVVGALAIWFDVTERKYIEEELRLKGQVLDQAHEAVYLIDEQAHFIYVNDEACRALGYSQEELLAMSVQDIDPAYSFENANAVDRQTRGESSFAFETLHHRRDGSLLPVEIQASALVYQGKRLGLAMARDITQRKAIEKALRDSMSILREAQRIARVGNWDVDMVNDKLTWSDEIFRIWEIDKANFKADFAAFLETVHPEDRARVNQAYNEAVANHGLYEVEHRLLFPDGRIKYILARGEPQYDAQGKPVRFIGTSLDITERKRLEDALAEREREHRSLAENSPDNIARWDTQGRYLYINPTHERLLGMTLEELIGTFIPESHEKIKAGIQQVVATGQTIHALRQAVVVDGNEELHNVSLVPEFDASGKVVSVLALGRDMTGVYRMQEAIANERATLRAFFDAMPDLAWMKDTDGRYLACNPMFEQFFGAAEAAILGKTDFDFVDAELATFFRKKDRAAALAGKPNVNEEWVTFASDGRRAQLETVKSPVFNADGKVIGIIGMAHDITERKRAETLLQDRYARIVELNAHLEENARTLEEQAVELEASKEQLMQTEAWYRGILQSAPDGMLVVDTRGVIRLVNEQLCRMFGYTDGELIGQVIEMLVPLGMRNAHKTLRAGYIASGPMIRPTVDVAGRRKDGSEFFVDVSLARLPEMEGAMGTICAAIRDVTERKRMEQALVEREQEFRTLVEHSVDTVARFGRDLRHLYVNPTLAALVEGGAAELLGRTPAQCPGVANAATYENKLAEVFAEGKGAQFELKRTDRTGREVCSLISLTPEFDAQGKVASVLAVGRDITELSAFRHRIHQMAFYDSLTSLPNRALFNDRLRQMLTDASWHGQQAGLMMLDMDRFKAVNDTLGHPAGDELLRETAARLNTCVRGYDTVARLGGDEFAILLPDIRFGDDLGRIASKILAVFERPFLLEGKEVFVSCSIGIALYPGDSNEADDLLKYADSAMYFAKRSGRNNFRFYSRDLTASAHEHLELESDLRRAIEREELELFYQPKVSLENGALTGSEALLRWKHPKRGMVPPDMFIGVAEDSGLIVEIGEWVLREACRTANRWNGEDKPLHKVAINLSARQFQRGDLAGTVCRALQESGCRAEWIELEITESLLLDEDGETVELLNRFKAMGISIAIDDFGTGYSALSYLARFPIGTLKIDRSFISNVTTDKYRAELVKAILSIARCLGQLVVAEGVETEQQAVFLRAHGCQVAQGYLYGKPVPLTEFERLSPAFDPITG